MAPISFCITHQLITAPTFKHLPTEALCRGLYGTDIFLLLQWDELRVCRRGLAVHGRTHWQEFQ